MSIIHIQKRDNPYVMIDKRPLENAAMSWQAKGMLTYLLSKPGNWNVCVEDLIARSKDGKASVYATIKELESLGHIVKTPHRQGGRIVKWVYDVFEEPKSANAANDTTSRFSRNRKSSSRKSISRKSDTSNNESTNNESSKKEDAATAAPPVEKVKKKRIRQEGEPVVHQDFVDAWYQFKEKRIPADEDVVLRNEDYKHLKEIREQLIKRKKGDKEKALSTWQYILDNWGKLEDFLQKMDDTSQVNRYMEKFLTDLRSKYKEVTAPEQKIASMPLEQVEDLFGGVNPDFKEPAYTPKFKTT